MLKLEAKATNKSNPDRMTRKIRRRLAEELLELERAKLEFTAEVNMDAAPISQKTSLPEVEAPDYSGNQDLVTPPAKSSALAVRTWRDRIPRWNNNYVPRDSYHDKINQLAASSRRIALVGLPGFGKTRLAWEFAIATADEVGGEVLQLRGDAWTSLLVDMSSELSARRKVVHDETHVIREFAAFVDSSSSKLTVIIDDLKDAAIVDRVIPPHAAPLVLVTAQQKILNSDAWDYVVVDEMSIEEAATLAREQLPSTANDQEARRLAEALAGYPIALISASVLLRKNSTWSIDDFCARLTRDAPRVLGTIKQRQQALTLIYNSLLASLEQENRQAAELLALISITRPSQLVRLDLERLFRTLPDHSRSLPADEYDDFGFVTAVDTLEDYVFISSSSDGGRLGIHQIVGELVQAVWSHRYNYVNDVVADWLGTEVLGGSVSADEFGLWRPTILALINGGSGRSLDDDGMLRLSELLCELLATSVVNHDRQSLNDLRRNWLFVNLSMESGSRDPVIAYMQYQLLSLTAGEDDPLSLIQLDKLTGQHTAMSFARKAQVANHRWDDNRTRGEVVSVSLRRSGGVRLIERLGDEFEGAQQALGNGRLGDARRLASSALQAVDSRRAHIAAHTLLARVAIRQLDLVAADHHTGKLRHLVQGLDIDSENGSRRQHLQHMLEPSLVEGLAADIAHVRFVLGKGNLLEVMRLYEKARDNLWCEAVPVGKYEVERKLNCALAHSKSQRAEARLRTLLTQTEAPIHLPTHYRTSVSLAKLCMIRGKATSSDVDACWRAAEFFATSNAYDRYWYTEAIFTAYLTAMMAREPESDQSLLYEAAIRECEAISRKDKIEMMFAARRQDVNLDRLLVD